VGFLLLAAIAAGLSLAATPAVRAVAIRLRALDLPGPRRVHTEPVPRLGGLAILAAGVGALALSPLFHVRALELLAAAGWRLGWFLAGVLVIVSTGVIDDLRGLGPRPKLGLQIVAAALALAAGYGLRGVTNPLTGVYVELGGFGGLLAILWIIGITNALNLIDGLDGLAAGVTLIASVVLFFVSLIQGRPDAACLWAVLGGALAGFLYYNFHPASIFLGDSGSLLLGYVLAVVSIQSLQKSATAVVVLAPLLALGLPVMEMVLTLVRRTLRSEPGALFRPDREHIHHQLVGRGRTHRGAVLMLYCVCVACGLLALVAVILQGVTKAAVVGVAAAGIYAGIAILGYGIPRGARQTR
jgi:UDP-GlcNAc:undecaprenyl-phosphate GlcNAc-1-phosphate transferase